MPRTNITVIVNTKMSFLHHTKHKVTQQQCFINKITCISYINKHKTIKDSNKRPQLNNSMNSS